MLLYAPCNYYLIACFVDLMGVAEPDQIISDVIIGVLHGVIQTPCSQEQ